MVNQLRLVFATDVVEVVEWVLSMRMVIDLSWSRLSHPAVSLVVQIDHLRVGVVLTLFVPDCATIRMLVT